MDAEIRQHFDYHCACEHDCCACWNSTILDLEQIGKWTFKGVVHSVMNV
jgi:hypothetical protein